MSYTYNPGTRPDALSILRDKGLLDTPARLDPKPGTFIIASNGHFRIGEDGRSHPVAPQYPEREPSDHLPGDEMSRMATRLSKLVIFGLTPVCVVIWVLERWG